MPDVEVKLNVEAETRQALQAIATMGKALDAVQQKAQLKTTSSSSAAQPQADTAKQAAAAKELLETEKQAVEVKKAANVETEKNIALTQQKTEAEDKDKFAMEVSLLSMQQLVEKLKELQEARKAAAEAQDSEEFNRLTGQFNQAKEQMEKLNVQMNLGRIAYVQQIQLANNFAQSLTGVVDGVQSIGEQAEKGELNIVGLAGAVQNAIFSFQAMSQLGLGWVGGLTLAIQALQAVWNSYAKQQQKIAEIEKENAKVLENEKTLYNELATARAEYDAQVALATSLKALKTEYEGIKSNLADSLKIIEESTRAEMVRLSIVKTEEEYKRLQERYELGRAYKRGDISEEEYRKQLLDLETAQQVSEAEAEAATQKARRKEQEEKYGVQLQAFNEVDARRDAAATRLRKEYGVQDFTITAYENTIAEQNRIAETAEERLRETLREEGLNEEDIKKVIELGYVPFGIAEKRGLNNDDLINAKSLLKTRTDALESAGRLSGEMTSLLGGKTAAQYKAERDALQKEVDYLTQQTEEARREKDQAREAYNAMPSDATIDARTKNAITQINNAAREKRKDIEADAAEETKAQQRAQQLEAAKRTAGSLTEREISEQLRYLTPGLSSSNAKERAYSEQMSAVYRAELERRQGAFAQAKKGLLSDGRIDESDIPAIKDLRDAARDGTAADKELYKAVMSFVQSQLKRNKDSKAFSKKLNEELAR